MSVADTVSTVTLTQKEILKQNDAMSFQVTH